MRIASSYPSTSSGRTERGMSAAFDFYEILIISPVRPELVEGYELI